MRSNFPSVRLTQAAVWAAAAALGILLLCFPVLLDWYSAEFRPLEDISRWVLTGTFYACAAVALAALWQMDGLLRRILRGCVFVRDNVRAIRTVSRCCLAVGGLCLCGAFGFPSLVFVSAVMVFLWLTVSVLARVMEAAVAMREESDLTV